MSDKICPDCGCRMLNPLVHFCTHSLEIEQLQAEVERLTKLADARYEKGLEDGRSAQAILELQGRDLFIRDLKDQIAQEASEKIHGASGMCCLLRLEEKRRAETAEAEVERLRAAHSIALKALCDIDSGFPDHRAIAADALRRIEGRQDAEEEKAPHER